MQFSDLYNQMDAEQKRDLANRAGTSVPVLGHLAKGRRKAGASLGARLKRADNRITDAMLRPDLYGGK